MSPPAQPGHDGDASDSGSFEEGERRLNEEPEVGYTEEQGVPHDAHRKEFRIAQHFIDALGTATLNKSGVDADTLARLENPLMQVPKLTRGQRAGVRMYLARGDASEDNYTDVRHAMMEYLEGDRTADGIPTYEQVKKLVGQLTGITAVKTDMCPKSCVAYTGPFEKLLECPLCREPRYEPIALDRTKRVARRTFLTFPLGPQLQSLWASPETAHAMRYRNQQTQRNLAQVAARPPNAPPNESVFEFYDDLYHGRDYLNAVASGRIGPDDMVLMFSIDGAQLYASKQSDCWFYIWILLDLSPALRYKKRYVLPGAVIGGPNKPRNIDSFLFPGLYHLAALQKEGLHVWDAAQRRQFISFIFLLLILADSPAMAYLSGLVGHNGANGCRIYCGQLGRHKPNHPTYYPALNRPHGDNSGPPNMTLQVETLFDSAATKKRYDDSLELVRRAKTKANYAEARLATGIAKPSLFSGLTRCLGVPGGFGLDLMHLISLNLTDLVISLLRGTLACEYPDNKSTWDFAIFTDPALWKAHGQMVADATRYLPGSFDRPPRDPAKKISSGYKAWEFLLYVYGLLPGLLRHILPEKYYRHFCWLVFGARFVLQYRLPTSLFPSAHRALVSYIEEYEVIYYCRRRERLHFVRPSLHTLGHAIPEASRVGPGALHTQWTMENYIGNITREIKQHVTPYANVSERALRRCQVNALKAMYPAFDNEAPPPTYSFNAGGGYLLLRARDSTERFVTPSEGRALHDFLREQHVLLADPCWNPIVRRWARLRLPNGQIARCAWKESALEARGREPRRARMVKV